MFKKSTSYTFSHNCHYNLQTLQYCSYYFIKYVQNQMNYVIAKVMIQDIMRV